MCGCQGRAKNPSNQAKIEKKHYLQRFRRSWGHPSQTAHPDRCRLSWPSKNCGSLPLRCTKKTMNIRYLSKLQHEPKLFIRIQNKTVRRSAIPCKIELLNQEMQHRRWFTYRSTLSKPSSCNSSVMTTSRISSAQERKKVLWFFVWENCLCLFRGQQKILSTARN